MFGHSSHNDRRTEANEANEPLLTRDDSDHHNTSLDSDDDADSTALGHNGAVRFAEHVQVIGPPLRSMLASRETGEYVSSSVLYTYDIARI
jgi:hypothetical protein